MPFLKKIVVDGEALGLWEIAEHPEDFGWIMDRLHDNPKFKKLATEKRRTEFLAVRALVAELTGGFKTVGYNPAGKPFISDEATNISISHSANLAAVLIHDKQAGIDVERLGRKVREIAHKFLSDKERDFAESTEDPEKWMTVMWCAKEALYKMAEVEGVDFIKQIVIQPFKPSESGVIEVSLNNLTLSFSTSLSYFFTSGNAVVWGVY